MTRNITPTRTMLAVIIILGIIFRVWASQPTWVHGDENYYINIFQNFVDRGELTPYMWRLGGETNIIAGAGTGYGIFVLIGWMKLFGESLFGIRMLMVLAGMVTAWLYYLTSRKWWGSTEAGVTAMVFGVVSTSAFYTLVGRMDALAILSYSLLLLLHITAVRQEKKWPHFLVGAVAILTTELHILGLLYVGAFAAYYAVRYLQIVRSERKLVLDAYPVYFFVGAGLLGVVYILVHILPDPEAYFIIPATCPFCYSSRIKTEVYRIIFMGIFRPHELIVTLLIIYFAVRRRKEYQHFLLLFAGYYLAQIIFSPPPNVQYFHHLLPLLSVGLAGMVAHSVALIKEKQQALMKNILLAAALVILCSNPILLAAKWLPYEFALFMPQTAEIEYIKENIPKSTVVVSTVNNFYPLKEYRNFLQFAPNLYYGLSSRGEDMADFLNRINPEVIYLESRYFDDEQYLQRFIDSKDFVQIMPDLWLAPELLNSQ